LAELGRGRQNSLDGIGRLVYYHLNKEAFNMPISPSSTEGERLESWKEIAAHLGKGVRTVERWERTEGLPVHRHSHEKASSVYAYKSEIDRWWNNHPGKTNGPDNAPKPTRRFRAAGATVAVIVTAAAVWLLISKRTGPTAVTLNIETLTSYPGEQYSPSFSPDASQFAFVWNGPNQDNFDIFVRDVGVVEPKPLTDHPDIDFSPAWSPDGKWIAFLRRTPTYRMSAWLIPASGGAEKKLCDLAVPLYMDATQLSWSPDGKWLAISDQVGGEPGLFLLSVETGEKRKLTRAQHEREHTDPVFSPDGTLLAFRCGGDQIAEICLLPLTPDLQPAGTPNRLTNLGVRSTSPVWTAGGREIVFSSGVWFSDSSLYRVRRAGSGSSQPQRLTVAASEVHVSLAAARRANLLAYTRKEEDANLWQVEWDGRSWISPKLVPMLSFGRYDMEPDISQDGKYVAYVSDRSGTLEIWVARLDGSESRRLTSLGGRGVHAPKWSPDGSLIAFSATESGHTVVYLIHSAGGSLRKFAEPAWTPSWSSNGKWLYYGVAGEPENKVFKAPLDGGPARLLETTAGELPQESADGRFLYTKRDEGLWRVPVAGGTAERVAPVARRISYLPRQDGIFTLEIFGATIAAKRWLIQFHRFADGSVADVASINRRPLLGLAVSPDGRRILYSQTDHVRTDIMLVRGLR
jgi:Tol biopolymer transport system component